MTADIITFALRPDQVISASSFQATSIRIGELVNISLKDGSIEYGPNYTPDAAAKAFWNALSGEYQAFQHDKAELEAHRKGLLT